MGFFDSLGSVLGEAAGEMVNSMQKKQERIMRYKARYEVLDDATLMRKLKNSSNTEEKMALMSILKERGYGKQ